MTRPHSFEPRPDFSIIECAICKKRVDKIMVNQSFEPPGIRIKVWCHGDTDQMILGARVIENIQRTTGGFEPFRHGTAFTTKRLADGGADERTHNRTTPGEAADV